MTSRHDTRHDAPHMVPASRLSRRTFVGTLGSFAGSSVLAACNQAPAEHIVPYVERPPEVVPGASRYYATTTMREAYGMGLLVESHAGRPTKIEGNLRHPSSLGKTLLQEQASLLSLYDPDRARRLRHRTSPATWSAFVAAFSPSSGMGSLERHRRPEVLLLEPTTSPLVARLLEQLESRRPRTQIYFNPLQAAGARWAATRQVLGEALEAQYRFDEADVVVAFDADFLATMPMSVRWAHDFAKRRANRDPNDRISRLYVVESAQSVTGVTADHRFSTRQSEIGHLAAGLLHAMQRRAITEPEAGLTAQARRIWNSLTEAERRWLDVLANDLSRHRGRSAVIVGDRQPMHVHATAVALNALLDNVGTTVGYTRSPILRAGTEAFSLDRLMDHLEHGDVETTFVLGGNPAYAIPPVFRVEPALRRAAARVTLTLYENETAGNADWALNAAHFLEAWGIHRAYDGTLSLQQPLIQPLYDGKTLEDVLGALAGLPDLDGHARLRQLFLEAFGDEEAFFRALSSGVIEGTTYPFRRLTANLDAVARSLATLEPAHQTQSLELSIIPDPRVGDGRSTNNPWLLELPEATTKLVWDNAALLAPETARQLRLARGDLVEIKKGSESIRAPVFPAVGQAPNTITIWLGWGRQGAESVARDLGVNVNSLREREDPWLTRDIELRATGAHYQLVTTQDEQSLHGRPLTLHQTLEAWRQHPEFAQDQDEAPLTLLPDRSHTPPQWGMTVDLSRCTGCSTCVIACQAENNVPVVGKAMVAMGREMHWLRIDTYHTGEAGPNRTLMQPMLCQHCEKAPCEYVCPVNATVHSDDGLNEMVYNRCVGTRFCSNNCPYKVRRFNYYDWNRDLPEIKHLAHNPNVTVRARGVMEKCTYCVQRIRRAQIDARLEARSLRDGDVQTACQQACPTDAIVFGLVSDPQSKVALQYSNPRTYAVLNDLGTRPRTRYLARIFNLNEELPS